MKQQILLDTSFSCKYWFILAILNFFCELSTLSVIEVAVYIHVNINFIDILY